MAQFQKGNPKIAGRKAGTPNKRTLAKNAGIREFCEQHDYDPLRAMVMLALDPATDIALRAQMHKELAKYLYPQLRSIEVSGQVQHSLEIEITWHQPQHPQGAADGAVSATGVRPGAY